MTTWSVPDPLFSQPRLLRCVNHQRNVRDGVYVVIVDAQAGTDK
jgi:hypothetical protein